MTPPKEKASEIVNELFERSLAYHDACIAAKYLVEQIIENLTTTSIMAGGANYWNEVIEEIGKP